MRRSPTREPNARCMIAPGRSSSTWNRTWPHGLRVDRRPGTPRPPPAALLGLRRDGNPDITAVLRSVMELPGQLPDLMRLAFDATIARAALRRGRALLGPALAFPDRIDLEMGLAPALG